MVKPELLARGEWATVVQLVREAVDLVREMREPGSRAEVK